MHCSFDIDFLRDYILFLYVYHKTAKISTTKPVIIEPVPNNKPVKTKLVAKSIYNNVSI